MRVMVLYSIALAELFEGKAGYLEVGKPHIVENTIVLTLSQVFYLQKL